MTAQLSKLLIAEAKILGLENIRVERRKKRTALVGFCSSGAKIKTFFSTVPKDFRAQKNAVAILRRTVRAADQGAVA
jgi:hypothetical protein